MTRTVPDLLLTVQEVATTLRLSKSYVKKLVAAGTIPSVKVGRSRRVRFADLEAYVDALPTGTLDESLADDQAAPTADRPRRRR